MVTPEPLDALLRDVAEHGAPAQRELARALLTRLGAEGESAGLRGDALDLVDAFRNDPYLWR